MKKAMRSVTLMMLFQLTLHVVASAVPLSDALKRILIYLGMLVPTAVFYLRRNEERAAKTVDFRGAVRYATLIAPFMLFICATIDLSTSVLVNAIGYSSPTSPPTLSVHSVLFSVILTPIIEELFMRGAVLDAVKKDADAGTAVVVSAILFALMHLNLLTLPYALTAGLLLGIARVTSGSVAVPIVLHATSNLMTLICAKASASFGSIPVFAVYFSSLALLCVLALTYRRKALLEVMRGAPLKATAIKEALLSPVLIYGIATLPLFMLNI